MRTSPELEMASIFLVRPFSSKVISPELVVMEFVSQELSIRISPLEAMALSSLQSFKFNV